MEPARNSDAKVARVEQGDALYRRSMEAALVGMALVGPDGEVLHANEAFCEKVGRQFEPGASIGNLMVGADTATVLLINRLVSGEAETQRFECELKHPDGSTVWVLAHAALLAPEQPGEPQHVSLQIIDIDKQKRAEAAVAYSESRLAYALESAGQGVWDYDLRTDQMYYSRMWRFMRGIPLDEPIDAGMEVWLTRVHPDDVPRIRAAAPKQAFGEHEYDTMEYRERHRDGHYVWILSRGRPVEWDESGKAVRTLGTDTDITHIKLIEEQLAGEKERLRVTLESIGDGVISVGAEGRITFMNPTAEQMTGWSTSEAATRTIEEVFSVVEEESGSIVASPVGRCLDEGRVVHLDSNIVLVGRNAEIRDVRATAAPLRTPDGTIVGAVLVFQDVTESRTLQRQLAHSATHDVLTELPNRLAFERALTTVAEQARREMRTHALCLIDLDRFKAVNDGAGHAAGDALLRKVADVLRRSCRRQDFAARIGGDEFAMLLPNCSASEALRVTKGIVDAVANLGFEWDGVSYSVGASIGITSISSASPGLAELMAEADSACYASKAGGRGRVSVHGSSIGSAA